MAQKIILIVLIVFSIAASAVAVNFYLKSSSFQVQVEQSDRISKKLAEDIKQMEDEKKEIIRENEKFQSDAVYYTKFTVQLQDQVEELEKSIEEREKDVKNLNEKIEALEKENALKEGTDSSQKILVSNEYSQLLEKAKSLEAVLQKERGVYYYNLGVAYVQAKLFSKAVESYEKSLSFEPNNPEAHYNLGLLYENFNLEPERAIVHYQRYLEFKPGAADKDEVLGWIKRLNDVVYQQIFPPEE